MTDRVLPYDLTPAERVELLSPLVDRFSIDPRVFDAYHFARVSKKYVSMRAADHALPDGVAAESTGIPFMRVNLRHPKLTTAATLVVGEHAGANCLVLSHDQAISYVRRTDLLLDAVLAEKCTGPGYVIVRWEDVTLGLGLLLDVTTGYRLKSLYPGRWSPVG